MPGTDRAMSLQSHKHELLSGIYYRMCASIENAPRPNLVPSPICDLVVMAEPPQPTGVKKGVLERWAGNVAWISQRTDPRKCCKVDGCRRVDRAVIGLREDWI